jgi:hypothetical protein
LPCRLQWGANLDTIQAYVVDAGVIPQNVDLLLGLDSQNQLDITIDPPAHSIFVRSQSLEIRTDTPVKFATRMSAAPLTVVATNSGASFVYCMFKNLGFRVRKWYTTEIDETASAVAAQIVPSDELHALGNTLTAKSALSQVIADVHISTPPCVSWSSLRNPPGKGFDDPSAAVFCASADISWAS